MHTVNLLPWRQQRRRHRWQRLIQMTLMVFVAVGLLVLFIWFRWQQKGDSWQSQILQLQQQATNLHQQMASSQKQQQQIELLQHKIRSEQQYNEQVLKPYLLLISLAPFVSDKALGDKLFGDKVHLISLSMESDDILLEAHVVKSETVERLISGLSASACFKNLKLHTIKQNDESVYKEQFTLSFRFIETKIDACLVHIIDTSGSPYD